MLGSPRVRLPKHIKSAMDDLACFGGVGFYYCMFFLSFSEEEQGFYAFEAWLLIQISHVQSGVTIGDESSIHKSATRQSLEFNTYADSQMEVSSSSLP
jgi:hypothetical protein